MMKGSSVFPIRVLVVDAEDNPNVHEPVTHVVSNHEAIVPVLTVYDGSLLVAEYVGYKSYTVTQLIPEIEEYKGEGFPL